ncbi:YihY/virulence factor BrkB family protein [Oscillatoria amoena NRMC-F 0135]|jgi:membrane protein|nr:YihY/virulence factor BrkB family protein [Oscillatoria amoena NRMC-F 0135]
MKYKYKRYFLQLTQAQLLLSWMKRVRFKKYDNVSLYLIVKTLLANLHKDEILDRANGVAFNFIIAIFPAIIFLFTLIPYVSAYFPSLNTEAIMQFLGEQLPPSMFEVISSTVLDIVSNQRGGLLSFGFLLSLYLSTNGMMALMRAFNACYKTIENRGALKARFIATALTINLAVALLVAIALLIIGQLVLNYVTTNLNELPGINLDGATVYLLFALRFIVIFIVFFLVIASMYYFGPAIHYNWRFFSIGSTVATFLILGVSYGFSYYITHFGTYNKIYGSIGVLIALMIWIQLITIVLLAGYELNASIHDSRRKESIRQARRVIKRMEAVRK